MSKSAMIYVMGPNEDGDFKVGMSTAPKERLLVLRGWIGKEASVIYHTDVLPNARSVERIAHEILHDRATGDEMFKVPAEVAIDAVKKAVRMSEVGDFSLIKDHRVHVVLSVSLHDELTQWRIAQPRLYPEAACVKLILKKALSDWRGGANILADEDDVAA